MLGALAAVALVAGTIGVTVSVSQDQQKDIGSSGEPVVEIQSIETVESSE